MPLPDDFLDALKSRVPLAEVVGRHVRLTRRGREYLGLCPFHGEKTPSFTVNEQKGFYHCFGCGAHGSAIDFVMQIEKLDFRAAVERLAAAAGLTMPEESVESRAREHKRRSLHDALEAAARTWAKMLRMPDGEAALGYLRRRGVGDQAIATFRLGFAPDARSALKAALARDGFGEDVLVECGLLIRPDDPSRSTYDRFRGRVMFPIEDDRGRIAGFGGRLLGAGEPKYLNTPETALFDKGRLLYNLARAQAAVRRDGTVIVVEGYMDVIGLAGAGWENVVAPLGTALGEEQLRLLWRLTPEPVLLFDPDTAGERAAVRAATRALPLLKAGFGLRFAFLATGTGDDPDGVARRYPKQFLQRALDDSLPLSELLFWAETRERRIATPEDRAALQERLLRHAATAADGAVRAHLQRAFRDRLWRQQRRDGGPATRTGRDRPRQGAPTAVVATPPPRRSGGDRASGRDDAGRTLLAILLHRPAFFDRVEEEIGILDLGDGGLDALRRDLVSTLSGREPPSPAELAALLAVAGHGDLVRDLLDDPLLRAHRSIAADAAEERVGETWAQNAAALRRAGSEAGPGGDRRPGGLARRLARRRAALAEDGG